jgi:hypothetical protein
MISSGYGRAGRTRAPDRDVPLGINVAAGSIVVVVAGFVSAAVPPTAGAVRLGLFALALGLFAATTVDPLAVLLVGVLGFAVVDGFLINRLGELTWHGAADVSRLWVLLAAAVSGLVVGAAWRGARRARLWRARREQIQTWAGDERIGTRVREVPAGQAQEWEKAGDA